MFTSVVKLEEAGGDDDGDGGGWCDEILDEG